MGSKIADEFLNSYSEDIEELIYIYGVGSKLPVHEAKVRRVPGIKDIIIIGSANKRAIEDHFDAPNEELLANLRAGGAKKQPLIDIVQRLSEMANFVYIRQKDPYGNANFSGSVPVSLILA